MEHIENDAIMKTPNYPTDPTVAQCSLERVFSPLFWNASVSGESQRKISKKMAFS